MMTEPLPLTTNSDPTTTTRRFRLRNDAGDIHAHGAIYPPPSCYCFLVFDDGHAEQYTDFHEVVERYDEQLVWVDDAPYITR